MYRKASPDTIPDRQSHTQKEERNNMQQPCEIKGKKEEDITKILNPRSCEPISRESKVQSQRQSATHEHS